MPIPSEIESRIAALAADNTSGATALAKQAATTLLQLVDPQTEISDAELVQQLTDVTYTLARTQPTMAPLLNLTNRVLRIIRLTGEAAELRHQIRGLSGTIVNQLDTSTTRIALHALSLLEDGALVLTHSYSSAVKKTLFSTRESGKKFSVICTESRPMTEGVQLARELADHGIPVTLIADAAAFSVLPEVTCVLVGADSVSLQGVVNKIGTKGLALAAQSSGIPFHVLCGTEKFIPEQLVMIEQTKEPRELLSKPVPNVHVRNFYFDTTPLELLRRMVTEEGILSVKQVRETLASLEKDYILRPSDILQK